MNENIESHEQEKGLSRRSFMWTSIRGGFALAAGSGMLGLLGGCSRVHFTGNSGRLAEDLERFVGRFPRLRIGHLPTPFEPIDRLTSYTGGIRLWMKRDDATGLAFGGNKTRKLEFIMADAVQQGANVIITWGGLQSNWCRQTVAAARMKGVRPVLILSKKEPSDPVYDGNLLLDRLMGAELHFLEPGQDVKSKADELAEHERSMGNHPYVVAVGGSRPGGSMIKPLGALSYTEALLEIVKEAGVRKRTITHIVHASGSGGTQAGLCVGAKVVAPHVKIVGISIGGAKGASQQNIAEIANELAVMLHRDIRFSAEEIIVFDEYVGGGYGILNPETTDAIKIVAREQGILLDPVYTGKAMAGLMDLAKRGYFDKEDEVVFLHTGGTPAIFPYRDALG